MAEVHVANCWARGCGSADVHVTHHDTNMQAQSARIDNTQGTCPVRLNVYRAGNFNTRAFTKDYPAGVETVEDLTPLNVRYDGWAINAGFIQAM